MNYLFDLETAKQRQEDLLREAQERRIAAPLRKARRSTRGVSRKSEGVEVSWDLAEVPHHRAFRR